MCVSIISNIILKHGIILQALESETIIPLCLANPETKIVLAGDHLQLMPRFYTVVAKKYDFHITLLERLFHHDIYNSSDESISQCRAMLTMNYRSCQEVHTYIIL